MSIVFFTYINQERVIANLSRRKKNSRQLQSVDELFDSTQW